MSQHDLALTASVIPDLACLIGEVAELQAELSVIAERHAAIQARLGQMIRDASQVSVERAAPAAQAATPASHTPSAQSAGTPENDRKASDERPGRGAGNSGTGQSEESRHVAEAEGASAASADTASAADERKSVNEVQAAALEGVLKDEPRVPRRPVAETEPTEPHVSRGDQVLDLWATTLLTYDEIAAKLKINSGTPSAYVSTARKNGDPRARQGDEPREVIRYNATMDLYAAEGLSYHQIDRRLGLPAGLAQKFVTKAWGDGDERAKAGDALRRPPRKADTPKLVAEPALDLPPIPDGKLILIDRPNKRIIGPTGAWECLPWVAKTLEVLDDGQLYGLDRMAAATDLKPDAITHAISMWKAGLQRIGIALVYTPHIGCKLNRIAA